jgi:putative SOS response-associated peptidase YedK
MCGRYTLRRKLNLLLSEFAADLAPGVEWEPRYNIPPTANVPAVRLVDGNRRESAHDGRRDWRSETRAALAEA